MSEIFIGILWALSFIFMIELFMLIACSFRHHSNEANVHDIGCDLKASIIVPAYNESLTLENSIKSIVKQDYGNYEIIIVDDGSKDDTFEIAKNLRSLSDKIKVFTKENGGKASALNYGIEHSEGDIVICLDADSIFLPNTLSKIMMPFGNEEIMAVCGNVKVSNRKKLIGKFQALEYILSLNLHRRTLVFLNSVQVISGCIGAFRKEKVIEVGGYSKDTLVEDMDLTIAIASKGYKIEYVGDAIAYTEAPESYRDLYKQRYRWTYGTFEVMKKYKGILFNDTDIGKIGLPYMIGAIVVNIITIGLILVILYKVAMGQIPYSVWAFITMIVVVKGIIFWYTIYMDKENKGLVYTTPVYLFYSLFLCFITIKAFVDFMLGKKSRWNKIKRLGKNNLSEI